jgi:hypothetical protein
MAMPLGEIDAFHNFQISGCGDLHSDDLTPLAALETV